MEYPNIKAQLLDKAAAAYGTAHVYSRRMTRLNIWIRLNTVLGILVPALAFVVVSTYNLPGVYQWTIWVAGGIGCIQLAMSVVALTFDWEGQKSYYLESSIENRRISEGYIFVYDNTDTSDMSKEYAEIQKMDASRNDLDDKYPFTEKETRRGHRWGLRQFSIPCAGCNAVPMNMKATKCPVCGNF